MESVVAVVGAFFFFLLVFPLIGAGAGFFLRVLIPYLSGGVLIHLVMKQMFIPTGAWWEYTIPLIAWISLILCTRMMENRRLAWHAGHWRAVMVAVTFGAWRKAKFNAPFMEKPEYGTFENI